MHVLPDAIVSMSLTAHDFGEPNVEAFPYPPTLGFHGLAPSLIELTGKPLRAFRG